MKAPKMKAMRAIRSVVPTPWHVAALALCLAPIAPAQQPPGRHAELSTSLTVTVDGVSLQFAPAALAAMPQTTVTVHNEHTKANETYTGVAVSDLLSRAGLESSKSTMQRLLHSYLRVQGSDFYFVLYAGTEIDSSLHAGLVIVALQRNGHSLDEDGRFQLVSTEDRKPARWVHNLISLTLVTLN